MKNLSLATLALIGGAAAYTDAENTETRTCVDGYTLDQTYDYIANGSCSQVEVASQTDVLTFEDAITQVAATAKSQGSYGFFYQMHSNGYQIACYFSSESSYTSGTLTDHGHTRGLVATNTGCSPPAPPAPPVYYDASNVVIQVLNHVPTSDFNPATNMMWGSYSRYPIGSCLGIDSDVTRVQCVNDDSVSDSYGDTCSGYYDFSDTWCGYYDTSTFTASERCCACKTSTNSPNDSPRVYASKLGQQGDFSDCAIADIELVDQDLLLYSVYFKDKYNYNGWDPAPKGYLGTFNEGIDSANGTTWEYGNLYATPQINSLWKIVEKEGGLMMQHYPTSTMTGTYEATSDISGSYLFIAGDAYELTGSSTRSQAVWYEDHDDEAHKTIFEFTRIADKASFIAISAFGGLSALVATL